MFIERGEDCTACCGACSLGCWGGCWGASPSLRPQSHIHAIWGLPSLEGTWPVDRQAPSFYKWDLEHRGRYYSPCTSHPDSPPAHTSSLPSPPPLHRPRPRGPQLPRLPALALFSPLSATCSLAQCCHHSRDDSTASSPSVSSLPLWPQRAFQKGLYKMQTGLSLVHKMLQCLAPTPLVKI